MTREQKIKILKDRYKRFKVKRWFEINFGISEFFEDEDGFYIMTESDNGEPSDPGYTVYNSKVYFPEDA